MVTRAVCDVTNSSCESATRKARLRHEVIFFSRRKRCVTEQIFDTPHVRRISDRPECRRGRAETMQIDWKAECLSSAPSHRIVNELPAQRSSTARGPDVIVRTCTSYVRSDFIQIDFDAL